MSLYERLRTVFVTTLELRPGADVESLRQWADPEWDSMNHAALLAAIESEFGLELEPEDAVRVDSFGAAASVLRDRGVPE